MLCWFLVEVPRRGGNHGHQLPERFVEPVVGPVLVDDRLVAVLLVVLDVSQLVVDSVEILKAEVSCAHPNPDHHSMFI